MKIVGICLCANLFAVAAMAADPVPVAGWVSHPVQPGERVLVSGGGWGAVAVKTVKGQDREWKGDVKVEMDGKTIPVDRLSDTGLVFKFPEDAGTGPKSFTIVGANGRRSAPAWINEPVVWWTLGDDFDHSTPGGTIRFFGRSLKGAQVTLRPAGESGPRGARALPRGGDPIELEKTEDDDYSVTAKIPADLAAGDYEAVLSAGASSTLFNFFRSSSPATYTTAPIAWTVAPKRVPWKTDVFDVTKFGAIPDDGEDDTLAVQAAVAAAATNGGGIVQFPIGTFHVAETIIVPDRTLLKGVSSDFSQIHWPDLLNATRTDYLILGRSNWGIHDLMLSSGLYSNGIGIRLPPGVYDIYDPQHDISLKNIKMRFICDQWREESSKETILARYVPNGIPIVLSAIERLELDGLDIYCDRGKEYHYHLCENKYMTVRNCWLHGFTGYSRFSGDSILVENCRFEMNTQSISPNTHRFVWKNNANIDTWGGDCESITTDLKFDVLNGQFAHATFTGNDVTLTGPTIEGGFQDIGGTPCTTWEYLWYRCGTKDPKKVWRYLKGMKLVAFEGPGAGQMRTIVDYKDIWHFTIDRPFDIPTTEKTLFTVQPPRLHHLYLDSVFEDGGCAVQLYGQQVDSIVARCRANRAGGFTACTMTGSGYKVPTWNIQFLDNEIVSATRPHDYALPRGVLGADDRAGLDEFTVTRGLVARRNIIGCNAFLGIGAKDMVAEKTTYGIGSLGMKDFGPFFSTHYIDKPVPKVERARAPSGTVSPPWTLDATGLVARVKFEVLREKPVPVQLMPFGRAFSLAIDGQTVIRPKDDRRPRPTYKFAKGVHEIVYTSVKPLDTTRHVPLNLRPMAARPGDWRFVPVDAKDLKP